jgi:hypothetical protein
MANNVHFTVFLSSCVRAVVLNKRHIGRMISGYDAYLNCNWLLHNRLYQFVEL